MTENGFQGKIRTYIHLINSQTAYLVAHLEIMPAKFHILLNEATKTYAFHVSTTQLFFRMSVDALIPQTVLSPWFLTRTNNLPFILRDSVSYLMALTGM